MTTKYRPSAGVDVLIEQAIAFGHSLDWMIENLHVDTARVDKVMRRMDEAISEDEPRAAGKRYVRAAPVLPCGTTAAYQRHVRNHETVDDACRQAFRAYHREAGRGRRLRRKAA